MFKNDNKIICTNSKQNRHHLFKKEVSSTEVNVMWLNRIVIQKRYVYSGIRWWLTEKPVCNSVSFTMHYFVCMNACVVRLTSRTN